MEVCLQHIYLKKGQKKKKGKKLEQAVYKGEYPNGQ